MEEIPDNAPAECPGTSHELAGKAGPCQGCPNQQICASGDARQPDPALAEIAERMATVRHKMLVLSGKGGVGKSTFSCMLARSLARRFPSKNVGLLDVDICGPSIPKMVGADAEKVHQSSSGWSPIYVEDNLSVMSSGFLIDNPDEAIIWRGPKKNGLIKQFLKDVDWGELDFLVIDTPPGTSDEHLTTIQCLLKATTVDGALLVTTPQEVALTDVRKEITFCQKMNLPIIGVVENMSLFVCPKCRKESVIFPPTTGGALALCKQYDLDFLGSVSLDPNLTRSCDEGTDFLQNFERSKTVGSMESVFDKVLMHCLNPVHA